MSSPATAAPGYLSSRYVETLAHIGRPIELCRSRGWLLERVVPSSGGVVDACGPYPLLCCDDWGVLDADLAALLGPVSVVCVVDPMSAADQGDLSRCFPDLLRPYKQHHVVDLSVPRRSRTSSHHRRNVSRAARELEIEAAEEPVDWGADWSRLYTHLADRHGITGSADFGPVALAGQLAVPGTVALRAMEGEAVVGMTVWYVHGAVAYYHLGAYDQRGYAAGASFGLFDRALELLAQRGVLEVDLGGAAGLLDSPSDGLARFKAGWSTGTRTAYLGGRVLQRSAYGALASTRAAAPGFFPAYRSPEVVT